MVAILYFVVRVCIKIHSNCKISAISCTCPVPYLPFNITDGHGLNYRTIQFNKNNTVDSMVINFHAKILTEFFVNQVSVKFKSLYSITDNRYFSCTVVFTVPS